MLLIATLFALAVPLTQQPTLTRADVNAITTVVVNDVAPLDGKLSQRPIKDRPFLLDIPALLKAMQPLAAESLRAEDIEIGRPFRAVTHDEAVVCERPRPYDCFIRGNYVLINKAARVPKTDEFSVLVSVSWSVPMGDGETINGFGVTLFLAHERTGWRIVRRSPYAVG